MDSANRYRVDDGPTPEFVRWSLDRRCALRESLGEQTPARVAALLRPLAAVDHCRRGGWTHGRLVLDPRSLSDASRDFDLLRGCFSGEVADYYGGWDHCQACCGDCPANQRRRSWEDFPVLPQSDAPHLAGCCGWLRRDAAVVERIERWFARFESEPHPFRELAQQTDPRWYQLWMLGQYSGERLPWLLRLLEFVVVGEALEPVVAAELADFQDAVVAASADGMTLSTELVPAGMTAGTEWRVGPYCPNCRSPMDLEQTGCSCCGRNGRAHPPLIRKRIGYRPFLQLSGLVNSNDLKIIKQQLDSLVNPSGSKR